MGIAISIRANPRREFMVKSRIPWMLYAVAGGAAGAVAARGITLEPA
jgi:hypothetical protein